jgi:hypothetical protein
MMDVYEVVWTTDAENDLAAVWLAASDRAAVTAACAVIDDELAFLPLTFGRRRTSSVNRVAVVPPLGVTFEVVEDDKRVFVQTAFASP